MKSSVWVGLVLAVIVTLGGCAKSHVRENAPSSHSVECDPSMYGSPCCAICHTDDTGADDPFAFPDASF